MSLRHRTRTTIELGGAERSVLRPSPTRTPSLRFPRTFRPCAGCCAGAFDAPAVSFSSRFQVDGGRVMLAKLRHRSGSTLIELLVVIAIIAVLIALLLP